MLWFWLVPAIPVSLWGWRYMFRVIWEMTKPNPHERREYADDGSYEEIIVSYTPRRFDPILDLIGGILGATVTFWFAPLHALGCAMQRHSPAGGAEGIGNAIAGRSIFDRLQEKRELQ